MVTRSLVLNGLNVRSIIVSTVLLLSLSYGAFGPWGGPRFQTLPRSSLSLVLSGGLWFLLGFSAVPLLSSLLFCALRGAVVFIRLFRGSPSFVLKEDSRNRFILAGSAVPGALHDASQVYPTGADKTMLHVLFRYISAGEPRGHSDLV
jgi:hypothetical protein